MPKKKTTVPPEELIETAAFTEEAAMNAPPMPGGMDSGRSLTDADAQSPKADTNAEAPSEIEPDAVHLVSDSDLEDGTAAQMSLGFTDALMIEDDAPQESISPAGDDEPGEPRAPDESSPVPPADTDTLMSASKKVRTRKPKVSEAAKEYPPDAAAEPSAPAVPKRTRRKKEVAPPVLTVDARGEVETQKDREDVAWHTIKNAHITRRILSGTLDAIEETETRIPLCVVYHSGYRIVIPAGEMNLRISDERFKHNKAELQREQSRLLNKMLGAEIDFVIKGIDSESRSVMASRRDAMLRKRKSFYFDIALDGKPRVYPGRVVQARVTAVVEKAIRVEIFGVECVIHTSYLSWEWIGDANERFNVGDRILLRVQEIVGESPEDLSVKADIRSLYGEDGRDNLKKCRMQGKYAGQIIDIHKGVVFIRLSIGVNAVAHTCHDYRMPGKKDDVCFVVTRIDEEQAVAVGIITRIIRQNL